MKLYIIQSGDKYYSNNNHFSEEVYDAAIYRNAGNAEKKIRDRKAYAKRWVDEYQSTWPADIEHYQNIYDSWANAEAVAFELVKV